MQPFICASFAGHALRFLVLHALLSGLLPAADLQRPNIVLILADDLGWSDLGCYGADLHETPRIDELARSGVRFTQAYAMSVCSPTRAMMLTGRHAARIGMTIWSEGSLQKTTNRRLIDADSLHDLPFTEVTLATRLRAAGYLTALVGKWHLGDGDHFPETHGFDVNIGGTRWGAPYTFWWPYHGPTRAPEYRYVPHLEFGREGEYLTDRLTDEALRVIDKAHGRPFFLFISHHAPHTPIEAKLDDVKYFEAKLTPGMHHRNPIYAAMVRSLDQSVGRVVDHLRSRDLLENTIVVFASDNGGFINLHSRSSPIPVTSNAPLRSGKGSLYEGGIRVPLLIAWPGLTKPDSVCTELVTLADLFPTVLGAVPLAQANAAANGVFDSVDLAPLLRDPMARLEREALFFHYPHYYPTTTPVSAIRAGDWKLLEYLEDGRLELFNLVDDLGEHTNLVTREPARTEDLRAQLDRWRRDIGARLPTINPAYQAKE